jgi:hypothetical protein
MKLLYECEFGDYGGYRGIFIAEDGSWFAANYVEAGPNNERIQKSIKYVIEK